MAGGGRFAGLEPGLSKLEAQNWVPRPSKRGKTKKGYSRTKGELIFMAIKDYIKKDMIRLYDGEQRLYLGVDFGSDIQALPGVLKGKDLTFPDGELITPEDLSLMVDRWIREYNAAWNSVRGSSVGFSGLNNIQGNETRDLLRNDPLDDIDDSLKY